VTLFRPCIDLHDGQVKQIVGGSLNDQGATTNFVSSYNSAYYANLYRENNLTGGHVIALGKGNEEAAIAALKSWPNGLQFGGGVNQENAAHYLNAGASHVIVTSALFENNEFSFKRLEAIKQETGKDKLILDLSCRRTDKGCHIERAQQPLC
jgi:phosphoribosylformimino-5-aminoimidazole carboxamide ribotide isomerase